MPEVPTCDGRGGPIQIAVRIMPSRHPPFAVIPTIEIEPIDCPHCGAKAHVIRRSPDPGNPKGEIRTFDCGCCGTQTEIAVLVV
jgi:hypothetical protein